MKTKFTPGPWTARQEYANRWRIEAPNPGGVTCVPLSLALVTTTVLEVGSNDRDTAANARLIAAAPEMLEVLDNIGGLSRALRVGGPDPVDLQDLSDALQEAVDMANTMVAKATGEQA